MFQTTGENKMNTITVNQVKELINQGYQVFTAWSFNTTNATGIVGFREYQTFASKNGVTVHAQSLQS
jgi:hypothetical protein